MKILDIFKKKKNTVERIDLPKSIEEILSLSKNVEDVLDSRYLKKIKDPLSRGLKCMWNISERIPNYPNFTAIIADDIKYRKLVTDLNAQRKYAPPTINEKIDCVILCQYFLALSTIFSAFTKKMVEESNNPFVGLSAMNLVIRNEVHKGFIEPTYIRLMNEISDDIQKLVSTKIDSED